jgi:cytochrome P450
MPPLVFLSASQDIRAILTAAPDVLHPGAGGAVVAPLVGESAFMLCEEDEHINGRNATMPAFYKKAVQEHTAMVAGITEREVASWPLDTAFPLHSHLRSLTLRAILGTVFDEENHTTATLYQSLMNMLSVTAGLVLQEPQLRHLPGWRTTWKQFVKRRAEVDALILTLIDRRRREDGHRGDLLDMLLFAHNSDGSPMSDRQIRDHLMSMIVAGHETTTAELAWAFQLLAHNQTAQNRLIEEIDSGTTEEYLTATVQETLRHRPAFLFTIPRVVVKPIEISGWNYHPPAQLLGCTYLMHHNPELYPDPHTFRPERFLGQTPQAGTWLPWGAGHKSCPGRHLALLEIQTVLREVFSTLLVLPASKNIERPRWRSAILTPHAGSRVILRRAQPPRWCRTPRVSV